MTFKELGLNDELLEAISYMGFIEATPIQEKAIPHILKGRDLIGCAQTGTGKTAAFLLPILHLIGNNPQHKIAALIIVPTRELALQIDGQIQGLAYFAGISSLAVYGGGSGQDWETQKKGLKTGADIVVATPGKLKSHLGMGYVDFSDLQFLILDEADRMLDMGFREDIMEIASHLPKQHQTLLFSATLPNDIRKLADKILHDPAEVTLELSKPAEGVLQAAYVIEEHRKKDLVQRLIKDKPNYERILIFSSTKKKVSEIVQALKGEGYTLEGISSDLDQSEREKVLQRFKARQTRVLVATDVLSRGIDIKDIDLVINFDVPGNAEDYVHRVGRTARAKTTGVAITLISEGDMRNFADIEKLIGMEVMKAPLPGDMEPGPTWNPRGSKPKYKKSYRGKKRSGYKKRR